MSEKARAPADPVPGHDPAVGDEEFDIHLVERGR